MRDGVVGVSGDPFLERHIQVSVAGSQRDLWVWPVLGTLHLHRSVCRNVLEDTVEPEKTGMEEK